MTTDELRDLAGRLEELVWHLQQAADALDHDTYMRTGITFDHWDLVSMAEKAEDELDNVQTELERAEAADRRDADREYERMRV